MFADGLYQSQMVAVFQHAKGHLLSDRAPCNRDALIPAGGQERGLECPGPGVC